LRESKRRRSFQFSEEGFAAKKWHDFQGKSWARISRQPAGEINPYGTDLEQRHLSFLVQAVQQHEYQEKGAFIDPYRSVRLSYSSSKFLGTFSKESVQHLLLGQAVRYDCLCTEIEIADLFSSSKFQARKSREEISKCCWFYFC
jgi:hypothetical protein